MHSLVPAVLLWLAGLDALGANAELDPPDRKLTESTRSRGCEGRAVVRPYDVGQAKFAKDGVENAPRTRAIGLEQYLAPQQVAAEGIHDGERVTNLAIACAELPLEIDAPDSVRPRASCEWLRSRDR
jgi:hypothetical protein